MKQNLKILAAVVITLSIGLSACQKEVQDEISAKAKQNESNENLRPTDPGFATNDMVMLWNQKTSIVLGAPMIQPTRTRLFAIVQIAVHDALNNIKPKYERFALQGREQFANPDAAVASAAHKALSLLGRGSVQIDFWRDSCLATIPDSESKTLGIALGIRAADAVVASRANDGFSQVIQVSQLPLDGVNPGEFRSPLMIIAGTFRYLQPPVKRVPNWGLVMQPYVIQSNQQFRGPGPDDVTSAAYTADFLEAKLKGARVGSTRTIAEDNDARFWSENRPSILWNNFTRAAIQNRKLDAWKTARLFALIHTSMAESINSTLSDMYHFYYWRPETAIRLAATDGNSNTTEDLTWLPFITEIPNVFPTPPQPEYPSSFAAYGGTTASILKSFFGNDQTDINLTSATLPGTVKHFTSFSQAARENATGTIFAGWNFRKSVIDGTMIGEQIGEYVFNNQFRELNN